VRIIKHKTRRRTIRGVESDKGFFVVEGNTSVGSPEEAVDIAIEVWSEELKLAKQAPTLWDVYSRRARCVAG